MIDFLDAPPFLRIALPIAMAAMHFHVLAQTVLILGNIFSHLGGPREQFCTHEKLALGMQGRLN